ncbi:MULTISPECIES: sensor histidine kinase [Brucella/Ochrobactrum group]|uniref:sensor histidine kinase n=1 Tax=Brucella/Ochrobactrum group TaxID=2826938 RepID=UPI000EFA7599|nr:MULTISPECIES: HAMP domain-containing sensor histidine kinase [Brucella/Ochrobactrum group]KAB2679316.1 HAMP domain-containing histidine kinase [Brucella pseudintermedia]MCO7726603.1 HAMP domain-containing histidine kinase [Brucella intermedia]TWH02905.1 two-component system, cell cycle sensor histidine kinase DivJ [Ochrobactrum sp. J50]WPM80708.1 HAMP domain-containing sensor histidine kinase [Brucella pseudintermedia]
MNAILLKTAESVRMNVQAISRFYERFCRRWVSTPDAASIRVIGSVVTVPVLLCAAVLGSGVTPGFTEFAILAASFAGMAMILCALSLMGVAAPVLAGLNFAAYGAGLAALGAFSHGNAVLWLMAAALPLEIWFATRKPGAAAAGAAFAAIILGFLATASGGAVSGGSYVSVAVLVLYAASLVARGFVSAARPAEIKVGAPQIAVAAGDVQFCLDADGVVSSVDANSARLLGVQPKMLEGTALIDRVHVADRVEYLSLLADLRAGATVRKIDVRLRSIENGETVFRAYRLEGAASARAITLIGRSLEGEQKLLEEIATLKAELESERIGKGRLLAAVSHELRTPLNSIIGFSDMLSHEMGGKLANEKQREYAGLIHQSGHYLLELVNAVLDNSRLETGNYSIDPQTLAFREAAEMCTAVMLPLAEKKGVAFCHRVGNGVGELVADRRAVQQILLNLAGNAVKFTQSGGCVTIDAARVMAEGRAMLEFSVSDTGIGIEPEDMQRIGTPFVRANNDYARAQEGSGLGLSVVKGLVELHQGTMQLKSCPGEGTIVTVRLPVSGPQFVMGEDEHQELGTVIDMHRHQGERQHDWQNDEIREQKNAQARKTA